MATVVRSAPPAVSTRLLFIDNIRWVMIALVISHHAAVTYSHVGGWYYMEGPEPPLLTKLLMATFLTFNQAYFMGLLFLLAGYFVPSACDKKGPAKFLRDRAIRLGIPSAFFMLAIAPVIDYWLLRNFQFPSRPSLAHAYLPFLESGQVFRSTGPMWFAVALLLFCIVYAAARRAGMPPQKPLPLPTNARVLSLIFILGTASFLTRITQPIGANVLNMQLCYFPQYILLFMLGIWAYRGDWLRRIPYSFGMFWFKLACFIGLPSWLALLASSGVVHGNSKPLLGGFHWQSAAFCYWEALVCSGFCLGVIVLFREKFNHQGPFSAWMSRNSFSAYLFHPLFLIGTTLALTNLAAPPILKFLIASVIAIPVTFAISGLIRERVPGLSRLL